MTYHPDNSNRPHPNRGNNRSSTAMWLGGIVSLAIIAAIVVWAVGGSDTQTADTPSKQTTGTATTTTTPPANTAPKTSPSPAPSTPIPSK